MKLFRRSVLFLAFTSFASLASAQTTWTGTDGTFETSSDWSSGTVPTQSDDTGIAPGTGIVFNITQNATESVSLLSIGGNAGSGPIKGLGTATGGTVNYTITNPANSLTIVGEPPVTNGATGLNDADFAVVNGTTFNFNGGGTLSTEEGVLRIGDTGGPGIFNVNTSNYNYVDRSFSGEQLIIGAGSNGTLSLNGTSTMTPVTAGAASYQVIIGGNVGNGGSGLNTTGTLNVLNNSTFTVSNGGDLQLGFAVIDFGQASVPAGTTGGAGIINQSGSGTGSTVNLIGTSTAEFGDLSGGSGTYNLSGIAANQLNISNTATSLGSVAGATGTINQMGGTLTVSAGTSFIIGLNGVGNYNLSGNPLVATAIFNNTTMVGDNAGSVGTVTQTGGALTANNTFTVGGNLGTGSYALSDPNGIGTKATFNGALNVGVGAGSLGSFTQSGGTLTTGGVFTIGGNTGTIYSLSGGTANINAALKVGGTVGAVGALKQSGGILNVNSGLAIGNGGGTGTFSYSGGTLNLTSGFTIGANGTFNQDTGLTLTNAVTQKVTVDAGGAYNLNAGVLKVGGSTTFVAGGVGNAGNFNFNGGQVTVTGSAWTDPLNGTIGVPTLIDTTAGDATLSGNLGGSGSLTLQGGGNLNLTGANNIAGSAWGVTVNGGTLNATVANLSNTGTITLGSATSVLNLNATAGATPDTFNGSIAGTAGAFNTGTKSLVLAGMTNLTGTSTTTIGAGGSLEVDQGSISAVNGAAGAAVNTFVVGNGTSTGTVKLSGSNTLPQVMVHTNSTLLAGTIAGSVTNGGGLGTLGWNSNTNLSTPSTLTLTGPVANLTSTGTLHFTVNGLTSDVINAKTVTLSGLIDVTGIGTHTYTIINASGGVTPGVITTDAPTALFSYTVDPITPGDTTVVINTVQNTLGSYALTPNQHAVSVPIDTLLSQGGILNPGAVSLVGALNKVSPASASTAFPAILDQLSPECLQYAREIAIGNATFHAQEVATVLANLRAGYQGIDDSGLRVVNSGFDNNLSTSLGSLLAYNPPSFNRPAPNGVNYYPQSVEQDSSSDSSPAPSSLSGSGSGIISDSPDPETTVPPSTLASKQEPEFKGPQLSEFILGNVVLADMNKNQSAANAAPGNATYSADNVAGGISFRMTSNLAAGVLFDYNHTDAKTDSNGSKTRVDSYSPGIYGTYFNHGFYANGLFSFGYNTYANTRNIPFLGSAATSSPAGQQYVTDFDLGYDYQPRKFRQWILGPNLGLTYTHLDVDSFNESGAGAADLLVGSQSIDSLRSRLGAHVGYQARSGTILFQPNLTATWVHEFLDTNNGITSQFNIPGSAPFNTIPGTTGKDSALLGCGLTATLDNSMAFYFNYLADVGASDFFAQSFEGGFRASF